MDAWVACECKIRFSGHFSPVRCLAVVADRDLENVEEGESDMLVSGSTDGIIAVWSVRQKKCMYKLKGHKAAVTSLATSNRTIFSGSEDKTVRYGSPDMKLIGLPSSVALNKQTTSIFLQRGV